MKISRLSVVVLALMMISWTACKSEPSPDLCEDPIGCVRLAPGEPIRIVALQALSGEPRTLGIDNVRAAELAIDARDNRILNHPIELTPMDDFCSKAGGKTMAEQIVADLRVVAIFGTTCSGAAVPAAKIMSEAGLSMISGSNTAPSLTTINGRRGADNYPGYFRTAISDEFLGIAAAEFTFKMLGKKRAATINDGDTFTKGLTRAFEQAFKKLGGDVVLSATVNKGDQDMRPVLEDVIQSGTEFLFLPIFQPEGDHLVRQARSMPALDEIVLASADSLTTRSFVQSVAEDGRGMYFIIAQARPEGGAYDAFVTLYRNKYGESPLSSQYAQAYDAVDVLLKTIAGIARPAADGHLYIGRQALRDGLYAVAGHQGLTGTITCDVYGDCGEPKFKVVRLDEPTAGIEALLANVVYTFKPAHSDASQP